MAGPSLPETETPTLPSARDLDRLDAEAFARALAPLFEGAPRFVARLAAARPFDSDAVLLDRAASIARTMPEEEQLELLEAHPRIGAPPGSVSALSFVEQGYDREVADAAAEAERERIAAELARLNAAYEARFGFRFVVFVAGRPRSAIVPLMEGALSAEREAEIGRALEDVVAIARDRVRKVRGQGSRLEEGS
jgi:2-oxo-4-hydroxy-4-carboxy--5-ureidoimidazoline (OHCU) decarboxylase